jgi:hypothetical protein
MQRESGRTDQESSSAIKSRSRAMIGDKKHGNEMEKGCRCFEIEQWQQCQRGVPECGEDLAAMVVVMWIHHHESCRCWYLSHSYGYS